MLDDELWFVASDVCKVIGRTNPTEALRALDKDEYKRVSRKKNPHIFVGFRGTSVNVISKAGMYSLLNRANRKGKPEVREFQRWVNHEVLPSIDETVNCHAKVPHLGGNLHLKLPHLIC